MVPIHLPLTLGAALLIAIAILLEKRRQGAFHTLLSDLHQERARFWRKRLQLAGAAEDDPAAADLREAAHRHMGKVKQLTEELRNRFREEVAVTEVASSVHDMELRTMFEVLARTRPDAAEQEQARHYVASAGRAAMKEQPLRAGVIDWPRYGKLMGMGMLVGTFTVYVLGRRYWLDKPIDFSVVTLVPYGVPLGACAAVLLAPWLESWLNARMRRTAIGVGLAMAVLLFFGSPAAEKAQKETMSAMLEVTDCPREHPAVAHNDARLPPAEECAVVLTALTAVPGSAMMNAYVLGELGPGMAVERVAEGDLEGERLTKGWIVTVASGGRTHRVHVNRFTGQAKLAGGE